MKRQAPPAAAPPLRRKRVLSGEERRLWESVAGQVKPLREKPAAAEAPEADASSDNGRSHVEPAAVLARKAARFSAPRECSVAPKSSQPSAGPPPLAPLGRRERSKLSRGRQEIDARLDLHGMTQDRAHRALLNFLHRASADGLTFVLVITGKGRSNAPDSERGVLRHQVPLWLALPEFRSLVVGFEQAHSGHGGAGALYVRVRRAR